MKKTPFYTTIFALLGTVCFTQLAPAQISLNSLTGGTYSQSFNSLASTGTGVWTDNSTLPGWYAAKKNNGTPNSFTAYTPSPGTGTAGALYSFGASGSSERALGSLASGNVSIGDISYGARFVNDTGSDVTSIVITYTGEQWRNGANASANTLAFSYNVSAVPITDPDPMNTGTWTSFPALDFVTPIFGGSAGALDGNASANRHVFSAILLSGAVVPPGSEIFLRWRDIDDSGTDHAVAIDDLTVSFTGGIIVTNAPTYATVTPSAQTNNAGTAATLTVTHDGYPAGSFSYQWRKGRFPISDTATITGSTTSTLTLSSLLAADAGSYDVIVANAAGSVTSTVATLTVIDPAITSQSASQTRLAGDGVTLTVSASGTPDLIYQWFFGSTRMEGETASSLVLSDLDSTKRGTYRCWVTNGSGAAVCSAPIALAVVTKPSVTLALWDFNNTNAPLSSPPPSVGAGTASLLNGVTATFATGTSSDSGGTNRAWNTAGYSPQGTSNKLSGVQFSVSTGGYQDLVLSWEQRHSDAASKYTRLQYSTDGTTFVDGDVFTMLNTNNSFVSCISDLSAVPGINNRPNVAIRIVCEWEATALGNNNSNYAATVTSYSTGGTIRFDLVTLLGNTFSGVSSIPLHIKPETGKVVLTWPDPAFVLQSAPAVTGTYTNISGAASPYTNPCSASRQFFRLKH